MVWTSGSSESDSAATIGGAEEARIGGAVDRDDEGTGTEAAAGADLAREGWTEAAG